MDEAIRKGDPCGDYVVFQRVGSGSSGEVYKARNLWSGEFAAVKMVKLETGDNFAEIQQEILMLKDCRHKNIISYYGSYLKKDRLWIVMEYCGGGSLQDIYQMTGPLTELQIAFVCRETLQGLQYLHERGMVHRDVKGANILLTYDGNVKLADFGIAAQITATLNKRRSFIGTPYWMAPEVANVENKNGGYGAECDVWALGITAIELAELKPPYYNLTPMQVLQLMTRSSYKIPKLKDKKKWSPLFANFVKCCLTKNPKKRPSPEKLLKTNSFVSDALSSRLTRELLDRVNHTERTNVDGNLLSKKQKPQQQIESESEQESDSPLSYPNFTVKARKSYNNFDEGSPLRPSTIPSSSSSSSKECLNSAEEDEEVFSDDNTAKRQSYHSERTLLATQTSLEEKIKVEILVDSSVENNETPVKRRPRQLRVPFGRGQRPMSSASEQLTANNNGSRFANVNMKGSRLLALIDESLRLRWNRMRTKSTPMRNVPSFHASGANTLNYSHHQNQSSQHFPPSHVRAHTCCFESLSTPNMGPCFFTRGTTIRQGMAALFDEQENTSRNEEKPKSFSAPARARTSITHTEINEAIQKADLYGDYLVLQRVGSGSSGEVYKARNLWSGEFAAVKMVKLETGDNFAAIQQEILMLKDCRHKNIISYYGSYLNRDRLWIVMEYCGGGSLQDIYQMTGPLTELQIAFVCRETLQGLQYLHERGMVHRDVKGANILLTYDGNVKLADFGIAAQITATLNKRRSFIGTPYWMAPEVANVENKNGGYGAECDVWALGITAIELAELKPPYYNLTPMQVLQLMTRSSYKIPKLKDKKKWSPLFANFVKCCLTKNPKKRPSPEKLLKTNSFVSGALSSRLTRELLDRIKHVGKLESKPEDANIAHQQPGDPQQLPQYTESESEQESDSSALNNSTFTEDPLSSSSYSCLNSEAEDEDHLEHSNDGNEAERQSYQSERTLLAQDDKPQDHIEQPVIHVEENKEIPEQRRPRQLRVPFGRGQRPVSSNSEQQTVSNSRFANVNMKGSRLLALIDESLRLRWNRMRSKSNPKRTIPSYHPSGANTLNLHHHRRQHSQNQQHQSRRHSFSFGTIPAPKGNFQFEKDVSFTIPQKQRHNSPNPSTQITQPVNLKQLMIISPEKGSFTLDLSAFYAAHVNDMTHNKVQERRYTWITSVKDSMTAFQHKGSLYKKMSMPIILSRT